MFEIFSKKKSISVKLMRAVFSIYIVIAIGVTALHMIAVYYKASSDIHLEIEQYYKIFSPAISDALWNIDQNGLKFYLDGMFEFSSVSGIRIDNEKNELIAVIGDYRDQQREFYNIDEAVVKDLYHQTGAPATIKTISGSRKKTKISGINTFEFVFPIHKNVFGKNRYMGELTIYSNKGLIFNQVKSNYTWLIVNSIIKTVALWFIVMKFGKIMLQRPLTTLTRATERLGKSSKIHTSPEEEILMESDDEIGILSRTFNKMGRDLLGKLNKLNLIKETGEYFSANRDQEKILKKVQTTIQNEYNFTNGTIYLIDEQSNFSVMYSSMQPPEPFSFLKGIERFHNKHELLYIKNIEESSLYPFRGEQTISFQSLLYVPLVEADQFVRSILLFTGKSTDFELDEETQFFIHAIAQLSTISINNLTKEEAERDRKAAEAASRAKSIFLANMSHEIRTPMNAILGYCQILLKDTDLTDKQSHALTTIGKSGQNLLSLINDILDISKIEAGQMRLIFTRFDVAELLQDLRTMFYLRCELKGIRCCIEGLHEKERIVVLGDRNKLNQVLINLLDNSVKFTDAGEVILKITRTGQDFFLFEVIDTGTGVSSEAQTIIFAPFQQGGQDTDSEGTGLGLSISSKLVSLMGGTLQMESEEEKGTRFFFELNLKPAQGNVMSLIPKADNVISLAEGVRVKALVVDDKPTNRDVLSQMLISIGVDTLEAANGIRALELVREHTPDIVFMDWRMSEMDGIAAVKELKQEYGNNIKTVITSASVFGHELEQYKVCGCHDILKKPISATDVYSCMAKLLHVEYICKDDENENTDQRNIDYAGIDIPDNFRLKLLEQAEFYQISNLQETLNQVEKSGIEDSKLVEHLRELVNQFNMDGIITIMNKKHNKN